MTICAQCVVHWYQMIKRIKSRCLGDIDMHVYMYIYVRVYIYIYMINGCINNMSADDWAAVRSPDPVCILWWRINIDPSLITRPDKGEMILTQSHCHIDYLTWKHTYVYAAYNKTNLKWIIFKFYRSYSKLTWSVPSNGMLFMFYCVRHRFVTQTFIVMSQ